MIWKAQFDHAPTKANRIAETALMSLPATPLPARSRETPLTTGTRPALHTASGRLLDCKWQSVAATIVRTSVGAESLSDDAIIWFLSVADDRDVMESSEVRFSADDSHEYP